MGCRHDIIHMVRYTDFSSLQFHIQLVSNLIVISTVIFAKTVIIKHMMYFEPR